MTSRLPLHLVHKILFSLSAGSVRDLCSSLLVLKGALTWSYSLMKRHWQTRRSPTLLHQNSFSRNILSTNVHPSSSVLSKPEPSAESSADFGSACFDLCTGTFLCIAARHVTVAFNCCRGLDDIASFLSQLREIALMALESTLFLLQQPFVSFSRTYGFAFHFHTQVGLTTHLWFQYMCGFLPSLPTCLMNPFFLLR